MPHYVALLRGINVGGNRLIKMEDLKQMFVAMKFKQVSTYIQSGNVFFDAKETEAGPLREKIENALLKDLGYSVDIYLRTADEIETIIKYDAFKRMKAEEEAKLNVSFLSAAPGKAEIKAFEALSTEIDTLHIHKSELYTMSYRGRGDNLDIDKLLKKQLGLKATTRNWNTTQKLYQLMSAKTN